MFRRKSLVFMLLFLLAFMSVPVNAFDATQMSEDLYIYDEAMDLTSEVEDELRKTLIEFDIQTEIRVVLVTLKEGEMNEEKKKIMEISGDNEVIIAFSKSQKALICSDKEIDIVGHLRYALTIDTEEDFNEFVKSTIQDILKQISEKENKPFETAREEIHLGDFINKSDLSDFTQILKIVAIIIIAIPIILIIILKILVLCIRELIETFFGSKFN